MQSNGDILVSIITVCFNAAETIETTIKSIVSQTYKNIEYIVVDGGSVDGTLQILEHYRKHISVIVSERDEGIYDAMNKGIDLAQGDFIGIINADDWYEEDAIEKVVRISRNISENTGVISGQIRFIDGEQSFLSKKKEMFDIWTEMPVAHPATFIKKSVYEQYGKYNTGYKIAADYDLIFRLYINHVGFYLCDEILANFRFGGTSSTEKNVLFEEDMSILKKYQQYCGDLEKVQDFVRRKESIQFFYQADQGIFCEVLDLISEREERIYIFGGGYWGREFARQMEKCGIVIKGFLDNKDTLWGSRILGYEVMTPDVLLNRPQAKIVIAVQGDTSIIEKQIMLLNKKVWFINLESVFEDIYRIRKGQGN